MDPWIEIYDNEQVQWHLRQQVTYHCAVIVASLSIAVLAGSIVSLDIIPFELPLIAVSIIFLAGACWTGTKIFELRNRVWCIKMSPHMVMGYDYRRSPVTISWSEVARVDVTNDAVAIIHSQGGGIEVPSIFPDFSYVGHRILDLAELHRVPVYLDGRSLVDTDVLDLLPELSELFSVPSVSGTASA